MTKGGSQRVAGKQSDLPAKRKAAEDLWRKDAKTKGKKGKSSFNIFHNFIME
jgi:hypothetical protein